MPALDSIWIAPAAGDVMISLPSVDIVAGAGLQGDRYAAGCGTFSPLPGTGRAVTLIAREDLLTLAENGIDLSGGRHRRNLVISGVDIRSLMRQTFRIGTAVLRGVRPAEPCAYLEKHLGIPLLKPMARLGGLRADVLESGTVTCGDEIVLIGPHGELP